MTDTPLADANKRFRSPPYPYISLDKAVERVGQLHAKAHHHAVGVPVLAQAWEFGSIKSSGLWATAAALLQFGLLTDDGTGERRKFQLTEAALRIARDPNPASEKRRSAIRAAAVSPKIFKELWDKFGFSINTISDVVLKSWLTVDRHEAGLPPYSDMAADEVIKVYKATIAYAGLTEHDKLPESQWEMDARVENDLASMSKSEGATIDVTSDVGREPAGRGMDAERHQIQDDFSVLLQGKRLRITATVDVDGIGRLKQVLDKYEEILKLLQ